jgi:hypothetical protein
VGGSCLVEEQCTLDYATCAGEEGNFKCECEEGYVHDPDENDACLKGRLQHGPNTIHFPQTLKWSEIWAAAV